MVALVSRGEGVQVVPGSLDVSFGMEEELVSSVFLVVHLAAVVNTKADYCFHRRDNVVG